MTDQRLEDDLLSLVDPDGHAVPGARFSPLSDPIRTERIVGHLADKVRQVGADVVAVWDDDEDVVLAYELARTLGLPAFRAWNADGLVAHTGQPLNGAQVLLFASAVREGDAIPAVTQVVSQLDGRVVAVAALVSRIAAPADGVSIISLVEDSDAGDTE